MLSTAEKTHTAAAAIIFVPEDIRSRQDAHMTSLHDQTYTHEHASGL
jgi:hypothetical protein